MSDQTIMQVVSEIRAAARNGQTVELDMAVDKLVMQVAQIQARADAIESKRQLWRDSQRRSRTVNDKKKGPHTPKEKTTPLVSPTGKHIPPAEPLFDEFWAVYPLKVGKGAARKAYRHALTRASHAEILAGAKRYAASRPDPKFTAHPATWLNADRWADQLPTNVLSYEPRPAPRTWAEIRAEQQSLPKER